MTASLAFPLLLTLAVVAVATSGHRRLPPRIATRFVVLALVLVVVAAVPTTLVIAMAFLAHVPLVGVGFQWCARAMGVHASISPWVGVPVTVAVGLGTWRVTRVVTTHLRLRVRFRDAVHVHHSPKPYALTLPGPAGQIVLSTALVDLLDEDEQRVVIAHEEAHARYRHDRFLLTAELVAAALPPLRGLARRVHFSVERWADEVAARVCGDREFVAMTLGKVALCAHQPTVAAFAGLGVASRMEALLRPPSAHPHRIEVLGLWLSLTVAAGFAAYQLHHLERLVLALCPH